MVSMHAVYDGAKKCTLTHDSSGAVIRSDAPTDIGGDGSSFSPTDLVGSALAGCILTTMAMFAERHDVALDGAAARVTKEMTTEAPRRIARLAVAIALPAANVPVDFRGKLEKIAVSCPVHKSLHPDIEAPVTFTYA